MWCFAHLLSEGAFNIDGKRTGANIEWEKGNRKKNKNKNDVKNK